MENILQKIPNVLAYQYFSGIDEKLDKVGAATDELIKISQAYWYIPLAIALLIAFIMILIGGKNGRADAKNRIFIALGATCLIMSIFTIVQLFLKFFPADQTSVATLGNAVADTAGLIKLVLNI